MSNKKYRLLKDLPDYKAGELFEFDGRYYKASTPCSEGTHGRWPPKYVENNPDWFQEVVEPERIEVSGMFVDRRKINFKDTWTFTYEVSAEIPDSKFPALKKAIEACLNESYGILIPKGTMEAPGLYTEADIGKAREDAFYAAKECEPQTAFSELYPTYEDYKNSLKK